MLPPCMLWSFMLETDSGLVLPTECPLVAEVQYVHSQSTSLKLVSFFIRLPKYSEQGCAHGSPQKHSPDLKKNTNADTHIWLLDHLPSYTATVEAYPSQFFFNFVPWLLLSCPVFFRVVWLWPFWTFHIQLPITSVCFLSFLSPFFSKARFDCTFIIQLHNTSAEQLLCPSFLY